MALTARGTSNGTIALVSGFASPSVEERLLADSISAIGLLRPLVIDESGTIIDGVRRAAALRLLGESTAPTIRIDLSPIDVTQAAALRLAFKGRGLAAPAFVGGSRATLDRVDKVIATAADTSLPISVRQLAAAGVTQIAAGASPAAVLTRISAQRTGDDVTARYPDLAHLDTAQAMLMAEYLDAISDPELRELELSVVRLSSPGDDTHGRALSMRVYTHMQNLARTVDQDRADEVASALAEAISGRALSPALRDRCLEVATQLERTAAGIRLAMTLEAMPR